jgi:hypothetical protein
LQAKIIFVAQAIGVTEQDVAQAIGVVLQVEAFKIGVFTEVVPQATTATEQDVLQVIGDFTQVVAQIIGAQSVPVAIGLFIGRYNNVCKCAPHATTVLPVPKIADIVVPEIKIDAEPT